MLFYFSGYLSPNVFISTNKLYLQGLGSISPKESLEYFKNPFIKVDAVVLFQTMIESRPLPTVIDFNRLFSAVARTKQYDLVLALCKQLELHMTTTR